MDISVKGKDRGKREWLEAVVSVERSNPVILRGIRIPSDMSLKELAAACCISFGREEASFKYLEKCSGDERIFESCKIEKEEEGKALSDFLKKGDELIIGIAPSGRKSPGNKGGIRLFLRVQETGDQADGGRLSLEGIPHVFLAEGNDLPDNVCDPAKLNKINNELKKSDFCTVDDGDYYSRSDLSFNEKKTENRLRMVFAPETARKEVNRKLGMPMALLLDKYKLTELKGIADDNRVYFESNIRKGNLIHNLCRRFEGDDNIRKVFEEMSVREFLSFRRFALSEALDEDECFEDELLEIYRRGLLCRVPKEGIRIASELLEYYEGFYGTVYEEKFLCEKYLKAALFAAARLYGIFRKEQFTAILKKYAPGEPDKDQVDEFFESEINSYFGIGIKWLKDDYFYYSKDIGEREALGLLKLMDTGRGNFYIPEKEETDLLALKGLSFSQKNKNILNGIIRDNSYYGYYDDIEGDSCDVILRYLHISGDVEGALKVAENRMKRLYWSNDRDMVLDKVRKILREEAVNLPLMIYNGFSGKNCPKEILSHVNDKRQLLEEKEKKKSLLPGRRRS